MPVTVTAKRALRSSKRKFDSNRKALSGLSIALHTARRKPTTDNIKKATSLLDKAAKKKVIHKNKAARLKSQVSKLVKPVKKTKV